MAHGYCTGCQATVTVRGGECLVGHPVDPSTVSEGRGRHARSRKTKEPVASVTPVPSPQPAPPRPQATLSRPLPAAATASLRSPSPGSAALIDRLWAETAEHDFPHLDWAADTGDLHRLGKRRRWGRLIALLLVAGAGVGGWFGWQYYEQETEAQAMAGFAEAVEQVQTATETLESTLGSTDREALVPILASLDDASRDLLVASGDLDAAVHGSLRVEASEAAARASELHDGVAAFHAYRALVGQTLAKPDLPVTAGSVDVAAAAASVGEWLGRIDAAVAEAPEHPLLQTHRDLVIELRPEIDDLTAAYLTAIREDDRGTAAGALSSLEQVLRELRTELDATEADVLSWATERLAGLRSYDLAVSVPG